MARFSLVLWHGELFTRLEESKRLKKEREESILKDITKWATDTRKYCASLVGFNAQEERRKASEKYLELKYDGNTLFILAEKLTLSKRLEKEIRNVMAFFEADSWDGLTGGDNITKRQDLDKACKTLISLTLALMRIRNL